MFAAGMVDVLESLHSLVGKLLDEPIGSDEASDLVQLCVEAERVVVAMRMMAARAVDSDHWKARGFRSAASWMAAEAGTPAGPAIAAMETLRLLDELPATAAAFREGRLSLAQVSEIADVASEWPATEQQLLDVAGVLSLNELREECRRVKAAAITDEGARLLAEVDARCGEMERDARAGRWYEGHDAHRADALVDLARTEAGSDRPVGPEAPKHQPTRPQPTEAHSREVALLAGT